MLCVFIKKKKKKNSYASARKQTKPAKGFKFRTIVIFKRLHSSEGVNRMDRKLTEWTERPSVPIITQTGFTHASCLVALKIGQRYQQSHSHKAKDITPSIAWRRQAWKEAALDDLPRKTETTPPSPIKRTVGPFQRQR